MLIDSLELDMRRQEAKAKKRQEARNQRLAEIAGKHPHLFSNPTALDLMIMGLEAQEGMA